MSAVALKREIPTPLHIGRLTLASVGKLFIWLFYKAISTAQIDMEMEKIHNGEL
jgi:hypothetical protein